MIPLNCVTLAAGNIHRDEDIEMYGFLGYNSIVVGRGIAEIPDLKTFIDKTHSYVGPPRTMGLGMKTTSWAAAEYKPGIW